MYCKHTRTRVTNSLFYSAPASLIPRHEERGYPPATFFHLQYRKCWYCKQEKTRWGTEIASSPGHSQILFLSRGKISGEGMGSKLHHRLEMVDSVSTNRGPHYVLTESTISGAWCGGSGDETSPWRSFDPRLLPIFLHGCEIKFGSGLGTRLGLEMMEHRHLLRIIFTYSYLPVCVSPLLSKGTLLVVQNLGLVKIFMHEAEGGA